MGTEEAAPMPMATSMGTSLRPPAHQPEPHHQVVNAAPKFDLNELIHAGKFAFNMKIIKVYSGGGANYTTRRKPCLSSTPSSKV